MRRRSLLSFALVAVAALCGASCLSPTLPVPPPEVDSVQQARAGVWIVAGSCQPGALVSVFDDNKALGVITEDKDGTGHFTVEIEADHCDTGWASQTIGTEVSGPTPILFEPYSQTGMDPSSTCH